jgi:hypothetical protein
MQGTFGMCSSRPVGCMKFLLSKEFITIFGPTFTPHKSNFTGFMALKILITVHDQHLYGPIGIKELATLFALKF